MRIWRMLVGLAAFAAQSLGAVRQEDLSCLETPLSRPIHEVRVSARSGQAVKLGVAAGANYLLAVSGTFAFSQHGRQDALRRWHEPFEKLEPFCVSCQLHPREARVSFSINGKTEFPLRECPFQHVYLHRVFSPDGTLVLQINDMKLWGDAFADNWGELLVRVYPVIDSHPLLHRDRDGFTLDQPVGQLAEELQLGTKRSEVSFSANGNSILRIEVHGMVSVGPGQEQDYRYRWDFKHRSKTPAQMINFNCAAVHELAADAASHRYLVEARGCSQPTRAVLIDRGEVLGQVRIRRFAAAQ